MKRKLAFALAALSFSAAVFASCPPSQPYRCIPGMNGKMICGCGV